MWGSQNALIHMIRKKLWQISSASDVFTLFILSVYSYSLPTFLLRTQNWNSIIDYGYSYTQEERRRGHLLIASDREGRRRMCLYASTLTEND